MSSHFATPRKPQPPTFWVEPATQKPADNPDKIAKNDKLQGYIIFACPPMR